MPLADLAEPLLRIVGEIIFEVLWKGAGYLIVKYGWYFGRRDPDPDGWVVIVVGGVFWILVGFAGYHAYRFLTLPAGSGAA